MLRRMSKVMGWKHVRIKEMMRRKTMRMSIASCI